MGGVGVGGVGGGTVTQTKAAPSIHKTAAQTQTRQRQCAGYLCTLVHDLCGCVLRCGPLFCLFGLVLVLRSLLPRVLSVLHLLELFARDPSEIDCQSNIQIKEEADVQSSGCNARTRTWKVDGARSRQEGKENGAFDGRGT